MLSRFSDALQSAADVLAPPATRLEDFEYHWKLILNFYQNYDENSKVHVEDTRIPHHLHQMLQLIVDEEKEQQGGTVGPCLEAIVQRSISLLDALTALCAADRPPGARALALSIGTALLRRTRQPCVNSARVYRPLQRMLIQCNESPASPTEKEEVELLLTLCGLVRKEPGLANIFTTPFVEDKTSLLSIPEDIQKLIPFKAKSQIPKKNPLFEVDLPQNPLKNVSIVRSSSRENNRNNVPGGSLQDDNASNKSQKTVYEENDKFLLIDLLLSYLNSADNQVVLRACEGIMIVSSLPDDDIANLVTSCSPVCESLIEKLVTKYKCIPFKIDPCDVEHLNITWGYVAQDFADKYIHKFEGYREITAFFSWLDYCDTLMKECHPIIAAHLARTFRQNFLEGTVECGLMGLDHTVVVTVIISKCLKVIDSSEFINARHVTTVSSSVKQDSPRAGAIDADYSGGHLSLLLKLGRLIPNYSGMGIHGQGRTFQITLCDREFSNWLVGDGEVSEWPLLHTLINNCLTDNHDLTLATLKFFESIIEKPTEHSIQRLVLCRLSNRGYYIQPSQLTKSQEEDERDRLNGLSLWQERERNREAMKQLEHEEQVNGQITDILSHEGLETKRQSDAENIHKVIHRLKTLKIKIEEIIATEPTDTAVI